jgi:hypothetical protein
MTACGLALVLAACAQTQTVNIWTKPGFDQTTFNADWYQCQRENGTTSVTIDPGSTLFPDTTVQQSRSTNYPMGQSVHDGEGLYDPSPRAAAG